MCIYDLQVDNIKEASSQGDEISEIRFTYQILKKKPHDLSLNMRDDECGSPSKLFFFFQFFCFFWFFGSKLLFV